MFLILVSQAIIKAYYFSNVKALRYFNPQELQAFNYSHNITYESNMEVILIEEKLLIIEKILLNV